MLFEEKYFNTLVKKKKKTLKVFHALFNIFIMITKQFNKEEMVVNDHIFIFF